MMIIEPTVEDILRGQGADPDTIASRKPALVHVAETARTMGQDLVKPQVITGIFSREDLLNGRSIARDFAGKNLDAITGQLIGAVSYSLTICTIGDGLEKLSNQVMASDFALALALDGMANAAIDRLVECVFHEISDEAEEEVLGASLPVSPGSDAWPLEVGQPFIFGLLGPDPSVIRLNESFLMLPKKSASFVVGVGPEIKRHGKTCDFCNMAETCRYRIRKTL